MTNIFISYRRADSEGYVGRLYDRLTQMFEDGQIFLDVGKIEPGQDFLTVINEVLDSCEALVAVIGPQWLSIRGDEGRRRLDGPDDYVRLEIATALKRDILIVPALVERAVMPRADELPGNLKALARRNAIELSHDRFAYDVDRLVQAIGGAYGHVTVSLGSTQRSLQQLGIMSSQESFQVLIDRKMMGKFDRTGPGLGVLKTKTKTLPPLTIKVEEGQHMIAVRHRSNDFKSWNLSNSLSFTLKAGQKLHFRVDRQFSQFAGGQAKIVLERV